MTVTLQVQKRTAEDRADATQLLGVVYGPKQENIAVTMGRTAFEKLFQTAGESTIITLEGLETPIEVLVHEVAFNPTRGGMTHVDFYAIERGKEMTTTVPLHFIGEAPIEKVGGMVNKILHDVMVTCRPSKLPSHLDIDISTLASEDDKIHVSDIVTPDGVKIDTSAEEVIATATAAREAAEDETESEPVDMTAVAVEVKGKAEAEAETA